MNVKGKFYLVSNQASEATWYWNVNRQALTDNPAAASFFDMADDARAAIPLAEEKTDSEMILCRAQRDIPTGARRNADTSAA